MKIFFRLNKYYIDASSFLEVTSELADYIMQVDPTIFIAF